MLDKTKSVSVLDILRFILDDEVPNSYAVLDEKMLDETIPKTFDLIELLLNNLNDLAYDCSDKTSEGIPNKCLSSTRIKLMDMVKSSIDKMNKYQIEEIRSYLAGKSAESSFYGLVIR